MQHKHKPHHGIYTHLIAMLNIVLVGALGEGWNLVEVTQIGPEVGVVPNTLFIALKESQFREEGIEMILL